MMLLLSLFSFVVVVVNVVHVVVVLIAGVDPRNLPIKFGFNQVINR